MRTNPIGLNNPDKTVWWKVDLGGLRNIYSISVLFKNYNDYGDYNLSLKLYLMPDAHIQYNDANPESSNNATFAQPYNGILEHVYVKIMKINHASSYFLELLYCYLFLTFIFKLIMILNL